MGAGLTIAGCTDRLPTARINTRLCAHDPSNALHPAAQMHYTRVAEVINTREKCGGAQQKQSWQKSLMVAADGKLRIWGLGHRPSSHILITQQLIFSAVQKAMYYILLLLLFFTDDQILKYFYIFS